MAVLPPNVSAEQFSAALRQFEAAVGKEWVFTSEDDLFAYRDHFGFLKGEPNERLASAAVGPSSVEQVQAIVRTANQFRIPLYAVSTGKNYGYGGASPNLTGSVVVDLKRMNRILEVDEHRHFALVEPGVSYFDLYRHIQERGLKVWMDVSAPGWGSPMGTALDHGIGYTMGFYRDHFGAHCGMEVVLANGEIIRTGMGAMPGSKTWQDYSHGFGPNPAGLFGQGNFGIVTKMGFRLMPQPEHFRTGTISVPRRRDFIPLVSSVNYLSDLFMVGLPSYSSPLRALMGNTEFRQAVTRVGGFNDEEIDRHAAAANLHAFQVQLQFYGSERTTLANWEYAQELVARAVPGARATNGESLRTPLTMEQLDLPTVTDRTRAYNRRASQGIPELGSWHTEGRNEQEPDTWEQTHTDITCVIPRSGELVFEVQESLLKVMTEMDLETSASAIYTPVNWNQFSFFMHNFGGSRDPSPEGKKQQIELCRRLLEANAKLGIGVYRASNVLHDAAADTYSFGEHSLRRFHEAIKDAVDPNGILSPGRSGIWPASYRSSRGRI